MELQFNILIILPVLLYFVWQEHKRFKFIKGRGMIALAVSNFISLTALMVLFFVFGNFLWDNYPVWAVVAALILAMPCYLYEYKLYKLKAPSIFTKTSNGKYSLENFVGYAILMIAILVYYIKQ